MDIGDLLAVDVAFDLARLITESSAEVDSVEYSAAVAGEDLVVTASTDGHSRTFQLLVLEVTS